jgi:hypothetical protein
MGNNPYDSSYQIDRKCSTVSSMTMTAEPNEMIVAPEPVSPKPSRKSAPKRPAAADPAKGLAKALQSVEKLEGQNHEAGRALSDLSALWLSADAKRKRGEAEIALGYFNAALAALRKSLTAM